MKRALLPCLLLVLFTVGAYADPSTPPRDPLSQKMTIRITKKPLHDLFEMMEQLTGFKFQLAQQPEDPDDYQITARIRSMPLGSILRQILGTDCTYSVVGDTVCVSKTANGQSACPCVAKAITPNASHGTDAESTGAAHLSDLDISVHLYTRDGTITAQEPLLAKVTAANRTDHTVMADYRCPGGFQCNITVFDENGAVVATTPPRRPYASGVSADASSVLTGQVATKTLVISALYPFSKVGKYTVRVQLLDAYSDSKVIAQDSADVRVLPYDAKRLKATIEELSKPINDPSASGNEIEVYRWSDGVRGKAILSIRDGMATPYVYTGGIIGPDDRASHIMSDRKEGMDWTPGRIIWPSGQGELEAIRKVSELMWAMNIYDRM